MVKLRSSAEAGVPLAELRAAVALARLHQPDADGVAWPVVVWERVWVRLTPHQQTVVYLHVLVGLTLADVSEQLGRSGPAVHTTWRRALGRIRDEVPRHG